MDILPLTLPLLCYLVARACIAPRHAASLVKAHAKQGHHASPTKNDH